jgi:hypothetical protein
MGGGHVREALRNVLTGALLWSPTLEQPLDKLRVGHRRSKGVTAERLLQL